MWLGDVIASKTMGTDRVVLGAYRVPHPGLWVFLISWSAILLDLVVGIGFLRYVAWNFGMVMLVLYGVQGVGVVRHWLVSRGVSGWLRVALGVGLILTLFWPGVNLIVMILVPGIGVSETWIQYRKSEKE